MAKRRRRTGHETIKTSIVIDVATYARWGACAALLRQDRSAFAVEAIDAACKSVATVIDKRKPAGPVKTDGSALGVVPVDPDADDAA